MEKYPNGAGFRPEIEDVFPSSEITKEDIKQAKEDGECVLCGGEKEIDLLTQVCSNCK